MDLAGAGDDDRLDHEAQRLADAKLVEWLRASGFAGVGYELFIERLTRYALGVIGAWVQSGIIFRRCTDRNPKIRLHMPWSWSVEDRDDLAVTTVAVALHRLRREGLEQGRWSPHGDTALSTYLIGLCLDAFPNEFRSWYRARRRHMPAESLGPNETASGVYDPERVLLSKDELLERLDSLTERQRQALLLREFGYSMHEVATILSVTYGAVANAVYRARRRVAHDNEERTENAGE